MSLPDRKLEVAADYHLPDTKAEGRDRTLSTTRYADGPNGSHPTGNCVRYPSEAFTRADIKCENGSPRGYPLSPAPSKDIKICVDSFTPSISKTAK